MDTFVVQGGNALHGDIHVGGAKNVALKLLIASLLTKDPITLKNVPKISDVYTLLLLLGELGVKHEWDGASVTVQNQAMKSTTVSLDSGAHVRTSSLVLGPLLARYGTATIPNPGGCRLGARPIDRHIEALRQMGADISYKSEDGYFHARAANLKGASITFPKNTHTGTEALILAAVLARGTTILRNAAMEVEVDDLISCLNGMGARITRTSNRQITIEGVTELHGITYTIMPDRNEEVTFAIAAAITGGTIVVHDSQLDTLQPFLEAFKRAGGAWEPQGRHETKYFSCDKLQATDITTIPHPGFMTDWQAPWAVLMTQAHGRSTIHETVFESRFSYVSELRKMGAKIDFFDPTVNNPAEFYNFNWEDHVKGYHQGISIQGPAKLHNAVLEMADLRAGATLLLAALVAGGESYIHNIEQIDRGYEMIEAKFTHLGAMVKRIKKEGI